MEKAKAIFTKTIRFEASRGQYWLKSARGKAWELWDENEMLKRVARIPCKRVYWIIPFKLNPEAELRALWNKKGVPKERQDELIREVERKAQPGAKVGPFVIGGSTN